MVDTGETARAADPSYFPRWHPYYRFAVQVRIEPEDEIGPRLRDLGLDPADVRTVVLTHFHTDHSGGLHHFPEVPILASRRDIAVVSGRTARLQGYLPHRWPSWFEPVPIPLHLGSSKPFGQAYPLTATKDIWAVPTPGHTPGHLSVLVRDEEEGVDFLLAGDTSYSQELLLEGVCDGVSPRPAVTLKTAGRILRHAEERPTVYLPSHDPQSVGRLLRREPLPAGQGSSSSRA